jgi:hypothetical protein
VPGTQRFNSARKTVSSPSSPATPPLPPTASPMEPEAQVILSHGRPLKRHVVGADEQFFHLVFSNKTHCDALCLEVRAQLIERGDVTVWQQTTNIPKDSVNWFNEWYPSASLAIKIVCFLTADYLKSPFCMKEFGIAQAKGKLLVVACEPLEQINAVSPREFPHASNALAYLENGGQVIFHGREDTVAEILRFTPVVERHKAAAAAAHVSVVCEPEPVAQQAGGAQEEGSAWPMELRELVGLPAVGACLREIGIASLADFAENFDVDEGHDAKLRTVRVHSRFC